MEPDKKNAIRVSRPDIERLKAVTIVVNSPDSEALAQAHLAEVRLSAKQLEEDIKKLKKPLDDAKKEIDKAAESWKEFLAERDQKVEQAILQYRNRARATVGTYNSAAIQRYEGRVANNEAKAIAAGKPIPVTAPPALKAEPAKTVAVDGAKNTETGYWTWEGIRGVGNLDAAKKLSIVEARRLNLDLPEEWFVLDTAKVTSCVKKNDRVPMCVLKKYEQKIKVTKAR